MDLRVENTGDPLTLVFAPEIPFSAVLTGASTNAKPVPVQAQNNEQDTHGKVELSVGHGETHIKIQYLRRNSDEGVAGRHLLPGQRSESSKLTGVRRQGNEVSVFADVLSDRQSSIDLKTTEKILSVDGATLNQLSGDRYAVSVNPGQTEAVPNGSYRHVQITLHMEPDTPRAASRPTGMRTYTRVRVLQRLLNRS